jgi:hypothetical protein
VEFRTTRTHRGVPDPGEARRLSTTLPSVANIMSQPFKGTINLDIRDSKRSVATIGVNLA